MTQPSYRTLRALLLVSILTSGVVSLAVSNYRKSLARAHDAVLREGFAEVCQAITTYTRDEQHAPRSLQDLVASKYLHEIPTDSMTLKKDWVLTIRDISIGIDQESVRLIEVRSASDKIGNEGVTCRMR
jgi:general secretion pathway protein G